MNILILVVSLLNEHNFSEVSYPTALCEETIAVKQTNLAALNCLHSMLKSNNETIDKIIAVCSSEVIKQNLIFLENQTTWQYFTKQVSEILEKDDTIIPVYDFYEDQSLKSVGTLIAEICSEISHGDTIYIDTTGGQRTHTNTIQLLTKMLRYKGIQNPCSFYSNKQKKTGTIETTESFTKLTDLADAVHEFATTGRSEQLRECLSNRSEPKLQTLLDAMKSFTDQIQLCSIKDIDKTLAALSKALDAWEADDSPADDEQTAVLKELLPVIREKFGLPQDGTELKTDYLRIIKWCLDNGLVQQAVTFIVEKSIVYIYNKGAFSYDDKNIDKQVRNEKKNPMQSRDECVNAFYNILMSSTPDQNERCKFKAHLQQIGKNHNPNYADFDELIGLLKQNPNVSIQDKIKSILKNPQKREGIKRIAKLLESFNAEDITKLLNQISTNDKLIAKILQQKEIEKGFAPKFETARNFEHNSHYKAYGFDVKDNQKIAAFMYGYLYAKALRNRINHASEEENLTEEQVKILTDHGYPISEEDLTVKTVMDNLQKILDTMQKF